jgi:hypothetical protein
MTGSEVLISHLDDDASDVLPFRYSITSYGADYPVDSLIRRIETGDLYIPSFQRDYVWNIGQASRFIETLLLGLPVPGIFLAKEDDTGRLLVIDGQQRLRTLEFFYNGVFSPSQRVFRLVKVQPMFSGRRYHDLSLEDRRRLSDTIIHATIVRQEEPSDDKSSIYHLFERINTGGTQLQPQEIRAGLFHGPFVDLLTDMNEDKKWRIIYGPISKRMRDRELIARFLALYFESNSYRRPMKEFLNHFFGRNRFLNVRSAGECKEAFLPTIALCYEALGNSAFKPKKALNAAIFDSVMVALARRMISRAISVSELRIAYNQLLENQQYRTASEKATADEDSIFKRIDIATSVFMGQ